MWSNVLYSIEKKVWTNRSTPWKIYQPKSTWSLIFLSFFHCYFSISECTYGCDWGPHATVHQRAGLSGACTEYGQTFFGPRFDLGGPHWPRLGPTALDKKVLRISETSHWRWTQKQWWWGKIYFFEEILYEFLPLWLLFWLFLALFGSFWPFLALLLWTKRCCKSLKLCIEDKLKSNVMR